MGVPLADQIQIADLADALSPVLEFLPMAPDVLSKANDAVQELAAYFIHLAEVKRADPVDDLFMAMVHAATVDAASVIDERELVGCGDAQG